MTPTEQELAEWARLADAATPGPWTPSIDSYFGHGVETAADTRVKRDYKQAHPGWDGFNGTTVARAVQTINGSGPAFGPSPLIDDDEVRDNAAFIAAARTAVPALLSALAASRASAGRLRELIQEVNDNHDFIRSQQCTCDGCDRRRAALAAPEPDR